ncbi:MAG: hypothetical protein ACFB4J_04680 [Elainellaceae cyanobacterium]
MELFYCFANASLTQRVLIYLLRKMRSHLACVTVIFLDDRWIMRLVLRPAVATEQYRNSLAVLNENGIPYSPAPVIASVFHDLNRGSGVTAVMNRYRIAIVSHGTPNLAEVAHFQEQFIAGLGYRPQSLA